MHTRYALRAYESIGLETGVAGASPPQLVVMLHEGAVVAIRAARQHLQQGDIAAKGRAISKAISIIDGGLRASLDPKVGGPLGRQPARFVQLHVRPHARGQHRQRWRRDG